MHYFLAALPPLPVLDTNVTLVDITLFRYYNITAMMDRFSYHVNFFIHPYVHTQLFINKVRVQTIGPQLSV